MQLTEYFAQFSHQRRVYLVGPRPFAEPIPTTEPVIWVDGGLRHRAARQNFGFAVGDGDSSATPLDQYLPREKDYSDLAYALRCAPANFSEFILLGFLGGRRDHELCNFGEAHHCLARLQTPCRLRFDNAVFGYARGEWRFHLHGVFSLAAFAPARVQLRGACEYKLAQPTPLPPLTSLGLSNRGFGEIILTAQAPVFIFSTAAVANS